MSKIFRTIGISSAQLEILKAICVARNYKMSSEVTQDGIGPHTNIAFYSPESHRIGDSGSHFALGSNGSADPIITDLTIGELFAKMSENWPGSIAVLKLNDDYNATVNFEKKQVNVGCQNFPFTIIDELHKLVHSRD